MGLFSLFGKSFDPESYEKEFSTISTKIKQSESRITRLKALHKRVRRYLVSAIVVLYTSITFFNYIQLPNVPSRNVVHRYVSSQSLDTLLILFVAYPVGSFGLMKLLQLVFSLLVRKNESYLKGLRTKQTKKIEELKKLTNFSSTEKILSRYDEAQVKKIKPQEKAVVQGKLPQTNEPMSEVHKVNQKLRKDLSMAGQSKSNGVSERLLDWAIGSSNNESIENRFALICKNCYAHNGLAPPNSGDPEGVVFRCWSCSYLNGATEQPPKLTDDVEPEDGGQLTEDGAQIGEEDTSKTAETIEVVSADEDNEPVIFGAKETALEKSKQGKELKSKPREELKSEAVEF